MICPPLLSLEGYKVVRISLVISKYNIHARVVHVIHHTVIKVMTLLAIARWRYLHAAVAKGVDTGQNSGHNHDLRSISSWGGVAGLG